jgi:hypothetical protein
MCFSAPFSFIAGGGLAMLSAASFRSARKKDRSLGAIPLFFGIQQAFEGVQWVFLNKGSLSGMAGYGYLFFALIFWPVYIPSLVFALDGERKKIMPWFILLGAAVAVYFSRLLLTHPLGIQEFSGSIRYTFGFPHQTFAMPAYLLAILGPLSISSIPVFKWFSLAIAALAFLSWKLYTLNFVSVWCLFAAIVSLMFFVYIRYGKASTAT